MYIYRERERERARERERNGEAERERETLASSEGPVRNRITPFIIQEACVSPGWTRAVISTPFRASSAVASALNAVIVSRSQLIRDAPSA